MQDLAPQLQASFNAFYALYRTVGGALPQRGTDLLDATLTDADTVVYHADWAVYACAAHVELPGASCLPYAAGARRRAFWRQWLFETVPAVMRPGCAQC